MLTGVVWSSLQASSRAWGLAIVVAVVITLTTLTSEPSTDCRPFPRIYVSGKTVEYQMSGDEMSVEEVARIQGLFRKEERIKVRLYYYAMGKLNSSVQVLAGKTHWKNPLPKVSSRDFSIILSHRRSEGRTDVQLGVSGYLPNHGAKERVIVPDFSCTIVTGSGELFPGREKVIYSRLDASQSCPINLSLAEVLLKGAQNALIVTATLTTEPTGE